MEENALRMLLEIAERHINAEKFSKGEIEARIEQMRGEKGPRQGVVETGGGVAVLPLYGPIFPRANMMTEYSGATSMSTWRQQFRQLMANENVGSIILDVDSPGGYSAHVPEMAKEIRDAREVKNIYAVANTSMYSAAFFLGSQATKLFATESGGVSNLGVYTVHEDRSAEQASKGIKTTFIYAGKYKTEGNPYAPLSEEARGYAQKQVDAVYRSFVENVAAGRGVSTETVEANYGQGRCMSPDDALQAGVIDGIASLDDVIGNVLDGDLSSSTAVSFANSWIRPVKAEVAEEEHSEPGDGNPPEPRPQPDRKQGYPHRYDTLPTEEDEMNADELRKLLSAAGIDTAQMKDEELTEDFAVSKLSELKDEVAPLREAAAEFETRKSLKDDYPEEYERMQRLEARTRKADAKEFAAQFERFSEDSSHGYSANVLTMIEEAHVKMGERQFTTADLSALLSTIGTAGIVEFGERGSSTPAAEAAATGDPKQDFFAEVKRIQEEDQVSQPEAVKRAAVLNPELFKAYRSATPQR
jgi:signal peptide peptidase SppA